MVRFLINRPIAIIVSFLALLLLGWVASRSLPTSLLPDADIPQINIRLDATYLAARDIELRLAEPLRLLLQQMRGLEQIESVSGEGSADIKLTFEHGTDMALAFVETNEKVDMAMSNMPKEIERPQVTRLSISDIPVFHLSLYDKTDSSESRIAELSTFVREIVRRRLEQLPEIAMVDVSGLSISQIQLRPRNAFLRSIGINESRLIQAFAENDVNLDNILVREGHYRYYLSFNSALLDLQAIQNIPININGRIFLLKEITEILPSSAPSNGYFYVNGNRAIDISIIKQSKARMEDLQKNFEDLVARFQSDYPSLVFSISQDQTLLLDYSLGNLRQDLLLGGVLAFFCMLIFIRQFKPAILIAITIPVSLIISQLGFFFFGISINMISLGGLILGLGMIIDNSIVVIDTISLHQKSSINSIEATVKGTGEIITPMISSVLTNCAVFLPLIFLSGLAGALFYDQALSVIIGVIASLLVAIFFLPPLYHLVNKLNIFKWSVLEIPAYANVTGWYENGIKWVFNHRFITFLLGISFLIIGVYCFMRLDKQRLPPLTRTEMEVKIDWNKDISLKESYDRIKAFLINNQDKWEFYSCWLGPQQYLLSDLKELGPNELSVYIKARDPQKMMLLRSLFVQSFARKNNGVKLQVTPAINAFEAVFSNKSAPLVISVQEKGKQAIPPINEVSMFVSNLKRKLASSAVISDIQLHPSLILTVDVEKAALYNIDLSNINEAVSNTIKPIFVDNLEGATSFIPIVIIPKSYQSIQEILRNTFVYNKKGEEYRLSSFIKSRFENDYQFITAGRQGTYYPISVLTENPKTVIETVEKMTNNSQGKLKVSYSGNYFENQSLLNQMIVILLISVLLLYFILAVQFESLIQPLFILAELPLAFTGAVFFLYIAGNTINLMSMIGIIIMSGLIINDSILKIDAINRLRKNGMPLIDAIYEGGHRRLKPIVMISLTSIGALLPTLFMTDLGSEIQKPLSLALLGGMSIGLLVSLFFVPLIYWLVYRKSADKKFLFNEKEKDLQGTI